MRFGSSLPGPFFVAFGGKKRRARPHSSPTAEDWENLAHAPAAIVYLLSIPFRIVWVVLLRPLWRGLSWLIPVVWQLLLLLPRCAWWLAATIAPHVGPGVQGVIRNFRGAAAPAALPPPPVSSSFPPPVVPPKDLP
jgi:hypothetical protein